MTSTLPYLLAAPRPVLVGGALHLATPATLGDLATLRAYVEDVAPGAAFGSDAATEALHSAAGSALIAYLALRGHKPGLTPEAAVEVSVTMDEAERLALTAAFFRRMPRRRGGGRSFDAVDWSRQFAVLLDRHPAWTHADVAGLTPEQAEHAAGGELAPDDDDAPGGRPLTAEEVAAFFAPDPGGTPDG